MANEVSAKSKAEAELEDVDLDEVEKTVSKAKAVKKPVPVKKPTKAAAKKVAVAKTTDAEAAAEKKIIASLTDATDIAFQLIQKMLEGPVPKDVVRWPHKEGSWMRENFMACYHGVKADDLRRSNERRGANWANKLARLRTGYTGEKRRTHTWKLNEEGGRFKLYDVKYVGKPLEEEEEQESPPKKKVAKAAKSD